MYEPNDDFVTPPDETVIWRYMNLERLLAMIASKTLYFTRLDRFRDTWEGMLPVKTERAMRDNKHRWGSYLALYDRFRANICINCWHEGGRPPLQDGSSDSRDLRSNSRECVSSRDHDYSAGPNVLAPPIRKLCLRPLGG